MKVKFLIDKVVRWNEEGKDIVDVAYSKDVIYDMPSASAMRWINRNCAVLVEEDAVEEVVVEETIVDEPEEVEETVVEEVVTEKKTKNKKSKKVKHEHLDKDIL